MSSSTFKIDFPEENDFLIAKITGKMILPDSEDAEKTLSRKIHLIKKKVIFDFEECTYIASYGYAVLVRIKRECSDLNINIAFANCNRAIKNGLIAVGFDKIVKVFDTIEKAKEHLTSI